MEPEINPMANGILRAKMMTGMGLGEIQRGMELAETDDPLLGACYANADGLAVVIKGDRHQWNLRHAEEMRDALLVRRTERLSGCLSREV